MNFLLEEPLSHGHRDTSSVRQLCSVRDNSVSHTPGIGDTWDPENYRDYLQLATCIKGFLHDHWHSFRSYFKTWQKWTQAKVFIFSKYYVIYGETQDRWWWWVSVSGKRLMLKCRDDTFLTKHFLHAQQKPLFHLTKYKWLWVKNTLILLKLGDHF